MTITGTNEHAVRAAASRTKRMGGWWHMSSMLLNRGYQYRQVGVSAVIYGGARVRVPVTTVRAIVEHSIKLDRNDRRKGGA